VIIFVISLKLNWICCFVKLDSSFYGEGARVSISSCKLLDDWLLLRNIVLISSIYFALFTCGRLCLKHWMASRLIFLRYVWVWNCEKCCYLISSAWQVVVNRFAYWFGNWCRCFVRVIVMKSFSKLDAKVCTGFRQ
jgi:hypothetical protein